MKRPKPTPEQETRAYHNLDKLAVKEAIREWMNEKWDETCRKFGAWSIRALLLLGFGAFIYVILWTNGWHKP